MTPKYPTHHDPAIVQTNADMSHYQYQQQLQQQQRQQQLIQQEHQQYQMSRHPQNNLQQRGQGREVPHNQPGGGVYPGDTNYPQKYLPPPHGNFAAQPASLGRYQRDYNTPGTNAAMQQDTPRMDDAYQDRFNNPPMSLDSFRSKNPAPVSEGINEEIRLQAEQRRHQQQAQDDLESGLEYDPYLVCHKCKRQFREGQLPEYRHHIDNCRQ